MFITGIFSNRVNKMSDKVINKVKSKMNGDAVQVIENIRTVKMLNGEQFEINRY